MPAAITSRTDLLLVLLFAGTARESGAPPPPIEGITRLEKLLFLLKEEEGFLKDVPTERDFHFLPFRMGPWTAEVYDEVDFLESLGLLEKGGRGQQSASDVAHDAELFSEATLEKYQRGSLPPSSSAETFTLTEAGLRKAREVWNRLSDADRTAITQLKRRFAPMNLRQFLRYVYRRYPRYTTESEIKTDLGLE